MNWKREKRGDLNFKIIDRDLKSQESIVKVTYDRIYNNSKFYKTIELSMLKDINNKPINLLEYTLTS